MSVNFKKILIMLEYMHITKQKKWDIFLFGLSTSRIKQLLVKFTTEW